MVVKMVEIDNSFHYQVRRWFRSLQYAQRRKYCTDGLVQMRNDASSQRHPQWFTLHCPHACVSRASMHGQRCDGRFPAAKPDAHQKTCKRASF